VTFSLTLYNNAQLNHVDATVLYSDAIFWLIKHIPMRTEPQTHWKFMALPRTTRVIS